MGTKFDNLIHQNILFDSHTHINTGDFDLDRTDVMDRARDSGLSAVMNMGIDYISSVDSIKLAKQYDIICAAVGLYPEICSGISYNEDVELNRIEELIVSNKNDISMIGEIGLDYYCFTRDNSLKSRRVELIAKQKALFRHQLRLAQDTHLPVSIHARDAVDECIKIVSEYDISGVFHSLTSSGKDNYKSFKKQVENILELGFLIGINGIITFKSAEIERNVFKDIMTVHGVSVEKVAPIDIYDSRFVFETDAPYLTPNNYRPHIKRRNEPESIVATYEFLKALF